MSKISPTPLSANHIPTGSHTVKSGSKSAQPKIRNAITAAAFAAIPINNIRTPLFTAPIIPHLHPK